jgi:LPS sulfotransferase NodH
MQLLHRLAPRPPRDFARLFARRGLERFVDRPYHQGGLVWIAADALGRYAILRQNRLPTPFGATAVWRWGLRRSGCRGVMVAGTGAAERTVAKAVRAELVRLGRADLPVIRFFGEKAIDWWCLQRRSRPIHRLDVAAHAGRRPDRICVILAGPRTGSSLAAELLARAGLFPSPPRELFNSIPDSFASAGLFGRGDLVRRYVELNMADNGMCGVKLQGLQFVRMLRRYGGEECGEFAAPLRQARVIRLVRKDRIAQAVSFCRAYRDGLWHLPRGRTGAVQPAGVPAGAIGDRELLMSLRRIEREDRLADFAARRFFRPENVLYVTYEGLTADLGGTVARMAAHLGHPLDAEGLKNLQPGTHPTREIYTDDLAARLARLAS